MKYTLLAICAAASLAGCNPGNKATQPKVDAGQQSEKATVDQSKLIVPGKSVGRLYLNQDMASVFEIMGKADAGDAAMGKAWSIWYSKVSGKQTEDQIAVYSSYKDSTMSGKSAKEILVTAPDYRTQSGLRTGISLDSIQNVLPALKQVARYVNDSEHDTLDIYDDRRSGIAFGVKRRAEKQISTAVYVHFPNESVNNTNLTIYPGWRQL
jgi:hypothetical protein